MKQLLLPFILILCISSLSINPLCAQWDKKPIIPNDFQNSQAPLWHDLNGDGLEDLVGYDRDISTFFWNENDGSKFLNPVAINDGSKTILNNIFAFGDWNNDNHIDIVAQLASSGPNEIKAILLLNDGNGIFTESEFQFDSAQFFGEITHFGDLNNDGFCDIITEHSSAYYIYINNNGTFLPLDYFPLSSNSSFATKLYLIDIDDDGLTELLEIDREFIIHFHEWSGNTLNITKTIPIPYPGNMDYSLSQSIDFVDLDYDGDLDIVRSIQDYILVMVGDVGSLISQSRYIYQHIQDDNSDFLTSEVYISIATGDDFQFTILEDKQNQLHSLIIFDGLNYSESSFTNGNFATDFNAQYAIPPISNGTLSAKCLFNESQDNLATLNNTTFQINVGSRSLVPEDIWQWENCVNCSVLSNFEDIEPADLDGDGDLDLIVSDPINSNQLVWIKNHLSGCSFDTINPILGQYFNTSTLSVESADLDNDGDQDIILKSGYESAEVYILKNNGFGSFTSPELLTTIPFGTDLYAEDIYQDGFAEIILHTGEFSFITQNLATFTTTILNNSSGIENYTQEVFMNPTVNGKIEFEDMDNDGDSDMVVYNDDPFNESVVIYDNNGNALIESQSHTDFLDMYGMDVFDIDQDSYPDILAFHDGISNNNISTLYEYKNSQGTIEFDNPIFLFENIDRYPLLGIHNPDSSLGFVSKTGFGNQGVLIYYNQSGIMDTLDFLNPENYSLVDLTNDGFDDILVADERGGLNFYTQDFIDCNEECIPDTEGFLYFENCNAQEYFLIETIEGEILDPYFGPGVNFNVMEGQYVKFAFTDFEIETPCEGVRTVLLQCIEEATYIPRLEDYPWVEDAILEATSCCEVEKIEAYYNMNSRYIYISPRSDCPQFRERLYDENEQLLCIEPEEFNAECITAYGLEDFEKVLLYQCDPVANENTFDESIIEVYPNPSNDVFNIKTEFKGKLKVLNAQGKCLHSFKKTPTYLDLKNLDPGLYFLTFENKKKYITKKIVKF